MIVEIRMCQIGSQSILIFNMSRSALSDTSLYPSYEYIYEKLMLYKPRK